MTHSLIDRLIARHRSGARCASALGISRQAFNAALHSGQLSEALALKITALLESPTQHPAPPIPDATSKTPAQPDITSQTTNYAFSEGRKKTADAVTIHPNVHVITSPKQQEAIDLIRWVYAVARLPADSPRFKWYVSRWQVQFKIARAKREGTFDQSVARCLPIDPAWVRFVPAALEEAERYNQQYRINLTAPVVSAKKTPTRKRKTAAT